MRFLADALAPLAAVLYILSYLTVQLSFWAIVLLGKINVAFFKLFTFLERYYDRSYK